MTFIFGVNCSNYLSDLTAFENDFKKRTKFNENLPKVLRRCSTAHLSTTRKNKTLFKTICTNEHWKHPIYLPECAIRAKSPILCRKFLPCCKKALLASKYYMWQTGNGTQCSAELKTHSLLLVAPPPFIPLLQIFLVTLRFSTRTRCVFFNNWTAKLNLPFLYFKKKSFRLLFGRPRMEIKIE